jgi:plastocyanin
VRAFPLSLVRVYAAIAVVAVVLTVVPGLIGRVTGSGGGTANGGGGAPAGSPGPGGGGVVSDTLTISASNSQSFDQTEVKAAASKPLTINFDNKDQAAPHNVAITKATPEGDFIGQPLADAGKQVTYKTPALAAGEYSFYCSVHPNMKGTLTAE